MDTSTESNKKPPVSLAFTWTKRLFLISCFLGLGSLNIATLISDEVHSTGYSALERLFQAVFPNAVADRVLSRSSMVKRRSDIAIATKALREEKAILASSYRGLDDKHMELERSYKDISAKHASLKAAAAKQAGVAKNVSTKIAQRAARMATRNVTSLFGEAIPLIGTALVVGVTVWDVHDLCETLKDINEVNAVFGHPLEDSQAVCGITVPSKQQVMTTVTSNWQSAYKVAAESINQAGKVMIAPTPPSLSWSDVKSSVCPIIGSASALCP